MNQSMVKVFDIQKDDFISAGEASSSVKKILKQLGVSPEVIKRAVISMYEAEMNAVIHGGGGKGYAEFFKEHIEIIIEDNGPGIENIELAMQEGYSTAPGNIREMGFGAGMGLPNIKKHSDQLEIKSEVGKGTTLKITINF
ncbi:MAG: ATP-binding protein [Clostridia bacterium]|nr:ATP-binding protein [Clostridia bacterium]